MEDLSMTELDKFLEVAIPTAALAFGAGILLAAGFGEVSKHLVTLGLGMVLGGGPYLIALLLSACKASSVSRREGSHGN